MNRDSDEHFEAMPAGGPSVGVARAAGWLHDEVNLQIKGFGWLGLLLPPTAVPLLLLLLCLLPLSVLTAKSLVWPLIDWVQTLTTGNVENVPVLLLLKLIGFIILGWAGLLMLGFRLTLTYYMQWAQTFPRPHPLHVAYAPDAIESMASLLQWGAYRLFRVALPPGICAALSIGLGVFGLFIFSWLVGVPALILPFIFTLGLFAMMMLGLAAVILGVRAIWSWLSTGFGEVIVITEPWLDVRLAFERARRLAWCSPSSFLFLPLYALYFLWCAGAFIWLLMNYEITDLLALNGAWLPVLAVSFATLVFYLLLNAMKLFAYHHALIVYYAQLPQSIKEQYAAPVGSKLRTAH
ncbi:MAG: hypothetical protein VKJ06_03485 [Vampirovibrionales bacterium]|nr:hypothetical protein [Vampirovibrionales bacterium]